MLCFSCHNPPPDFISQNLCFPWALKPDYFTVVSKYRQLIRVLHLHKVTMLLNMFVNPTEDWILAFEADTLRLRYPTPEMACIYLSKAGAETFLWAQYHLHWDCAADVSFPCPGSQSRGVCRTSVGLQLHICGTQEELLHGAKHNRSLCSPEGNHHLQSVLVKQLISWHSPGGRPTRFMRSDDSIVLCILTV